MGEGSDKALKGRLRIAIILTGIILVGEVVGGLITGSLALLSDAAHVLMDVVALGLSLLALHISALPPNERRTFGLHRSEVFASFVNSLTLIFITVFIVYKAFGRIMNPVEVESFGMLVVAAVGLGVNLLVAVWLMSYASKDMNIRSAYLHVVGDAAASVGVIVGAVIIGYTGLYVVDPLISFVIAAIIFFGAWGILRDSSHILLEGVPKDVDLKSVVRDIKEVEGVEGIHDLHIWSICHSTYALSAHLDVDMEGRERLGEVVGAVNGLLAGKYHIHHTTLQAECEGCDTDGLFRSIDHHHGGHGHGGHHHGGHGH